MAAELDKMKDAGFGFVRAGHYTVAWEPHDTHIGGNPYPAKGVIKLATALRNPSDREDPLEGAIAAGRRLFEGHAITIKVPKGRSVRRYVRKMLSV
jgi:hypothetical protein